MTILTMAGTHADHTTLSVGSTGDEVKYLQGQLNRFYATKLPADGNFQFDTEAQVRRFQTDCSLTVDGIVGQQTWSCLETILPYATSPHTVLRRNSSGDEVSYLQVRLNGHFGPELKVDSAFGARTEAQVKRFQRVCNIAADGIVGTETWRYVDRVDFDI